MQRKAGHGGDTTVGVLDRTSPAERPAPRGAQARTARQGRWRRTAAPYLWILPSILLITTIILFPIIDLFWTSLSEVSAAGIRGELVGLAHYVTVVQDPVFRMVFWNSVVWTVSIVVIATVLSLGIASLINRRFPGRPVVRSVLLIPWAVSLLITAVLWRWILDYNYGSFNEILRRLGVVDEPVYWLAEPSTSFPAMIGVGIFVTLPFTSFVLLAGLQSIPHDLYEAGRVDRATAWQSFRHITLPLLRPALAVSVVLNTIYVFNSFPIIWSMTRGGPLNQTDIVFTYLYKLAFEQQSMGEAAAISVLGFLVLLVFAIAYVSLVMRKDE
jgi:multiple sugar transport system permease protein